jgi:hypothetical protein
MDSLIAMLVVPMALVVLALFLWFILSRAAG